VVLQQIHAVTNSRATYGSPGLRRVTAARWPGRTSARSWIARSGPASARRRSRPPSTQERAREPRLLGDGANGVASRPSAVDGTRTHRRRDLLSIRSLEPPFDHILVASRFRAGQPGAPQSPYGIVTRPEVATDTVKVDPVVVFVTV